MLFLRIYYLSRPFIPNRLRLALRRWHATHIAPRVSPFWPVLESAGNTPPGWPGWPEKKDFALVLTHDVEGPEGLKRVQKLAELELQLGFRSAFNLVPEGTYRVDSALRDYLRGNGFEIGVHDLHHDGKLYDSHNGFIAKAKRINQHLQEWNACGFRSAFMLHNLNWIHELNILYDSSTFDVDPYEPQPDGVSTIFPFWVPLPQTEGNWLNGNLFRKQRVTNSRSRLGYIELPYTLPQDSTLFLFLKEKDNSIWKNKLDWIASRGGMALLNVHPDYINFDGAPDRFRYPVEHYLEFLRYVKEKYKATFWNGLPREVASYFSKVNPVLHPKKQRHICMLAATHYETDARVSRYVQSLIRNGDRVEVIACSQDGQPLGTENRNGAIVHRITHSQEENKRGPISHLIILLGFFVKALTFINKQHRRDSFDLIHVHNIPEWLVFATLWPKLTGTKVLLDIHDLVPELFLAKFKKGGRSLVGPFLRTVERISCSFAEHVIVSNHLWRYKLIERSVPKAKCSVFINHIDLETFSPRIKTRNDDRIIILFHGSLQWHQGMDIAIRAFERIVPAFPTAELHIYGCGGEKPTLQKLVCDLNLEKKVLFLPLVPVEEIPQIIANSDLGIVPKRVDSFGNEAYSTKIMEFMSQGVPVVISRTAIDSYYFTEKEVYFCESGNVDAFAAGVKMLLSNPILRQEMVQAAHEYVTKNHWGIKEQEYLGLIDQLIHGTKASTVPSMENHPLSLAH